MEGMSSSEKEEAREAEGLLHQGSIKLRCESYGSIPGGDKVLDEQSRVSSRVTPLPWCQLLLVFVMRLAEPIAYTQIFPYVNEMMEHIGAARDALEAGYYSGLTESVFAVCELLTVVRWGKLSDRIGRKPVLMAGFIGAMTATLLFGFSTSFVSALLSRGLAGALSGNVAVLLSAVGEITDETNQAQAYAIFGVANNLAQIAGPSIGGTFADPDITFPHSFGRLTLFKTFPYALPCIISALLTLISALGGAAFFKETLNRSNTGMLPDVPEGIKEHQDERSVWQIGRDPVVFSVLAPFFMLSILNTSMLVVFSLFAYTPIHSGGLSREPEEIGFAIASSGIIGALIQVILLPALQRRFGTLTLYKFFMSLWPATYMLFPILNMIARATAVASGVQGEDGGNSKPASFIVWLLVGLLLALNRLASMAYSLNLILTKNAAPSSDVLGSIFALSQFVNCCARSLAPAFVSSLFSLSGQDRILGGNFVWVVMCSIALLGVYATFHCRDGATHKRLA